jgi:hypothetical protein
MQANLCMTDTVVQCYFCDIQNSHLHICVFTVLDIHHLQFKETVSPDQICLIGRGGDMRCCTVKKFKTFIIFNDASKFSSNSL